MYFSVFCYVNLVFILIDSMHNMAKYRVVVVMIVINDLFMCCLADNDSHY